MSGSTSCIAAAVLAAAQPKQPWRLVAGAVLVGGDAKRVRAAQHKCRALLGEEASRLPILPITDRLQVSAPPP